MAKPNYPKGTTPRKSWDFPPDIFWITPDGVAIDIIGHVTAMQARPETFGLHKSPTTKKEIDDAFRGLWAAGWVRGRFSDGTFYFQMERPRGKPLGNCFEMVLQFKSDAESVEISFADPEFEPMGKSMTAEEFLDQKFPTSWRINPGRGRR
jgi:hypothetical protein